MRVPLELGDQHFELEIAAGQCIAIYREPEPTPLVDVAGSLRSSLEAPTDFPPLRSALTPDDHIAIVVDEQLSEAALLLTPILEHITSAGVQPEAITLLCTDPHDTQPWLEELPEQFESVNVEIHNPNERKKLSYLATTKAGRRVYLNRTAVEADQVVVLTGRRYHPALGYSGAETALFPALSDSDTQRALTGDLTLYPPGAKPTPVQQEASEVAWLLGAPFFVQIIEGRQGEICSIVCGLQNTSAIGQQLLDQRWRVEVEQAADVVVATLAASAKPAEFADLAQGLANAARVVKNNGRIILLTESDPDLGAGASLIREIGDSRQALLAVAKDLTPQREAVFNWASATDKAHVYLYSRLPEEVAEELLTVPLQRAQETQKLVGGDRTCLYLPDANKLMAVLRNPTANGFHHA